MAEKEKGEAYEIESSPNIKITSKTSTSNKLKNPEDTKSELTELTEIMSKFCFSTKLEAVLKVLEECQMPKATSEMSTFTKLEAPEALKVPKACQISTSTKFKISEVPEIGQVSKTNISETSASNKTEEPEISEVRRTCSETTERSIFSKSEDDDLKTPKMLEEGSSVSEDEESILQYIQNETSRKVLQDYRIRFGMWPPISAPDFEKPQIVLATYHMVPALPMELFDVLAEMIEAVTNRPVVLMHEKRLNRPFAREITDIVVMPATETWRDGVLLPASFVFDHPRNKTKSADVYVDVVVAKDRSKDIKSILDFKGQRGAISDGRFDLTATGLLFKQLTSKGENFMYFFGSLYETTSQYHVLKMILDNRADVGVVESPVITCRKYEKTLNVKSLNILQTLGHLPPYRIMVKNALAEKLNDKLATYLLNVSNHDELMVRLLPYGVTGFATNSEANYQSEYRNIATKVPYY